MFSFTGMGIVPANAEMTYLEKVKWLDMYGVDLHPVIVSQVFQFYIKLPKMWMLKASPLISLDLHFWEI